MRTVHTLHLSVLMIATIFINEAFAQDFLLDSDSVKSNLAGIEDSNSFQL